MAKWIVSTGSNVTTLDEPTKELRYVWRACEPHSPTLRADGTYTASTREKVLQQAWTVTEFKDHRAQSHRVEWRDVPTVEGE